MAISLVQATNENRMNCLKSHLSKAEYTDQHIAAKFKFKHKFIFYFIFYVSNKSMRRTQYRNQQRRDKHNTLFRCHKPNVTIAGQMFQLNRSSVINKASRKESEQSLEDNTRKQANVRRNGTKITKILIQRSFGNMSILCQSTERILTRTKESINTDL